MSLTNILGQAAGPQERSCRGVAESLNTALVSGYDTVFAGGENVAEKSVICLADLRQRELYVEREVGAVDGEDEQDVVT